MRKMVKLNSENHLDVPYEDPAPKTSTILKCPEEIFPGCKHRSRRKNCRRYHDVTKCNRGLNYIPKRKKAPKGTPKAVEEIKERLSKKLREKLKEELREELMEEIRLEAEKEPKKAPKKTPKKAPKKKGA